jgi:hypothetical protein
MNEVAIKDSYLALAEFDKLAAAAEAFAKTEMVPKSFQGEPESIIVAWQAGRELGLQPMQSLANYAVINGKASLYGDGFVAVVTSHKDFENSEETFDDESMTAVCTVSRKGRSPITRSFSKEDAERAGLWERTDPWKKYPKRMLQCRARGFAFRDMFPDALCGVISAEEAADIPVREVEATVTDNDDIIAAAFSGATEAPAEKEEIIAEAEVVEPEKAEKKKEAPAKKAPKKEEKEEEAEDKSADPIEEIFDTTPKAIEFAIFNKKLKKGQTFKDLPKTWVKSILKDPEKFKAAVAKWVKEDDEW